MAGVDQGSPHATGSTGNSNIQHWTKLPKDSGNVIIVFFVIVSQKIIQLTVFIVEHATSMLMLSLNQELR
jgi:hypothetical protein